MGLSTVSVPPWCAHEHVSHHGGIARKCVAVFPTSPDEWRFLKRLWARYGPIPHDSPPLVLKCTFYRHTLARKAARNAIRKHPIGTAALRLQRYASRKAPV